MISLSGSTSATDPLRGAPNKLEVTDEKTSSKPLTFSPMSSESGDNCLFSVNYNSWDDEIGLQLFNKDKLQTKDDAEKRSK